MSFIKQTARIIVGSLIVAGAIKFRASLTQRPARIIVIPARQFIAIVSRYLETI